MVAAMNAYLRIALIALIAVMVAKAVFPKIPGLSSVAKFL